MAYIEPNSTIWIMKGVPLDPSYDHTIYWNSESDRNTYFQTKTKYVFARQMYQRVNKGRMRILKRAEDLYDCNYLAFQSNLTTTTPSTNKWFYCFITGVEYVNNEVTEISYVIDVMTTYHFDYTLGQCFVEREHSETDNVGDNLIPENLDLGEYVYDAPTLTGYLTNRSLVVASTFNRQYADMGGALYNGIYSGLVYNIFDESNYLAAEGFISGAQNKSSGFVAMFYYPSDMLPADQTEIGTVQEKVITKTKKTSGALVGNYVPRNNKLYTYPYNFLYVSNNQGNAAEYRYEFFSQSNCGFKLSGDLTPCPTMMLRPMDYKGDHSLSGNFDEAITVSGWGQVPFATDSYKAWLAQAASSLLTKSVTGAISGAMIGGAAGGVVGAVGTAAVGLGEIGVKQLLQGTGPMGMPKQAHGNSTSNPLLSLKAIDFFFYNKHITKEYAEIIDSYFTRYGYACHKLKVPNRSSRPQFNFVKTMGCLIEAAGMVNNNIGLPADDEEAIKKIYDNGITFWKNPANIGDYTVSNAPVST